jgi:hypothetical protein
MDEPIDDTALIPVLTEVVTEIPVVAAGNPAAVSRWLENRLQEALLPRAQRLIDEQLQREVEHVIARATQTLMLELHDSMQRVARDVIAQVVSEEAARLRTNPYQAPGA